MKATSWWLGDLARAADRLADAELSAVAAPMDYAMEPALREPRTGGPAVPAPSAAPSGPSTPMAPVPFWRVESAWFAGPLLEDGTEAPPPELEPLEEPPEGSLHATPEPPDAEPWATRWPRLRSLLQREAEGRAPNLRRLVRCVAKGQVVETIPRLARPRWPDQLDVWLDRSTRLVPLLADQEHLVDDLKRTLGSRRVRDVWLDAASQQACVSAGRPIGPTDGTHPGATVLVLGDLGAGASSEVRAAWARSGAHLRRRGISCCAWVPEARATPFWNTASWERARPVAVSQSGVDRLLTLASMAALLEPSLLRAIRLGWRHHGLTLSDELALVRHSAVQACDVTAVVLERAARQTYRDRFGSLPEADRHRLTALLVAWHAGLPGEVAVAESLALQAAGAPVDALGERAVRFVQQLAAHLDLRQPRSAQAESWRVWGRRITQGLPEAIDGHAALQVALSMLRRHARPDRPEDSPPPRAPRRLHLVQQGAVHSNEGPPPLQIRTTETREAGQSLLGELVVEERVEIIEGSGTARRTRVSAGSLAAGVALDRGEGVRWRLRTDHQELELAPWTRPPWAAGAGRDEHGLWVDLEFDEILYRLRWIPPGRYLRGSPPSEEGRYNDEGPQHSVVISHGFWLGRTPVTQALWGTVMGDNPSHFQGPERPVEQVSWKDARRFCQALEARCPGLDPRLPTEAEWEYACRAGTRTATWVGDLQMSEDRTTPQLDSVAWYAGNSGQETKPVAGLEPNPWGLYDMLGNVWEWCQDAFEPYSAASRVDPVATTGGKRVYRGGGWLNDARYLRAAYRYASHPGYRDANLGFRLAGGPAPSGGAENGAGDRSREVARDAPEGDPSGSTSS